MGPKQGWAVVSFSAPLDQVFLVFGSKSFVSPDKYVLRVRQEIPPPFSAKVELTNYKFAPLPPTSNFCVGPRIRMSDPTRINPLFE